MDLGYIGDQFTWTNYKIGNERINERLDRALCSAKWRTDFDEAFVSHEQRIGSDHCPLSISFHRTGRRNKVPFRFDARWLDKEECGRIIRDTWPTNNSLHVNLQ
ncbi:hypothetical protein LINGRAHAP2_LOCUS14674 [Linum grandiflorum]